MDVHKQFLQVIDLPLGERDLVIRELTLMGVTPGSLFPGLDGTAGIAGGFLSFSRSRGGGTVHMPCAFYCHFDKETRTFSASRSRRAKT